LLRVKEAVKRFSKQSANFEITRLGCEAPAVVRTGTSTDRQAAAMTCIQRKSAEPAQRIRKIILLYDRHGIDCLGENRLRARLPCSVPRSDRLLHSSVALQIGTPRSINSKFAEQHQIRSKATAQKRTSVCRSGSSAPYVDPNTGRTAGLS